ncbi:MAG: hypothetical protein LAP85_05665 [Acidobacteriia bacterium]|nr:hypothetical protein [Terriglobia bacterium]
MFLPLAVLTGVLAAPSLCAQTQLVSSDHFPAALEFKELKAIQEDKDVADLAALAKLEQGPVYVEAGLNRYAKRTYALADSGNLAVEIMTMADPRGAFSLLTLLAKPQVRPGPPGDFFTSDSGTLLVAVGNYCVRIRSNSPGDLPRRVATSVANRIGRHEPNAPNLIRHFPTKICDLSSIRYFLGSEAMATFGTSVAGTPLKIPADVEAAQALCAAQGQTGTLTLLSFPTIQIAEDYFNSSAISDRGGPRIASLYTRQTGPLVCILEGNFIPQTADETLGSIKFSYAIKWIFDKSRQQGRTIWGVPVRILGTVVRSLLFTVLLCLASIIAGILIAAGRVYVRRRWGRPDDDGYIRLKINED